MSIETAVSLEARATSCGLSSLPSGSQAAGMPQPAGTVGHGPNGTMIAGSGAGRGCLAGRGGGEEGLAGSGSSASKKASAAA